MPSLSSHSNQKQTSKPQNAIPINKHSKPTQPCLPKQVPIDLQQLLLDIFRNTFAPRFQPGFPVIVQQIKQHLFHRDFNAAFGNKSFLEAYAMRWSPSRALAYTHIFWHVLSNYLPNSENLHEDAEGLPLPASPMQNPAARRIVCVGGGAGAEVVALAAYLHLNGHPCANLNEPGDESKRPPLYFAIEAIDIADWSTVLEELHSCLTTAPPSWEHSQSAAKRANAALISPATCTSSFMQGDILKMRSEDLAILSADAVLVTLMFTLNELYSTSITSTTNLLLSLTLHLGPGALLLVVDSPGSYSTVSIGKTSSPKDDGTGKRYPMQWLLDHTLLESAAISTSKNASADRQWEKLESKESEWFRLSNELRYPVSLEDMRYQLHLYRRL